MLRASIEYQGKQTDLRAVTQGTKAADSGVTYGDELVAFAEAAIAGEQASLATARGALRSVAGSEAVVDAAGVIGNFQRMVRIADGAGISIDAPMALLSADFREEIGLDAYGTADRIASSGPAGRALGAIARTTAWAALRFFGRRARAKQAAR